MTTESAAVCTAKVVNEKEAMDERLIAEELPGRQLDGPLDNAQMVLGCPRGDGSSRQVVTFSLERRPRPGQTPRS